MTKKFLLLILASIFAFFISELFVRFIIGYPKYGLEKKVKIRDISWSNIWKPYSKYWNVECGNRVFKRNNLGLPGVDVNISKDSKYIFILGSSFVEALQVPPEKMATSILQQKLNIKNSEYQVLNIAYSGDDPYDSFRRLEYFSNFYQPESIILVIDKTNAKWFKRHKKPLDFFFDNDFGRVKVGVKTKINLFFRNHSSFISIFANGLKSVQQKKGNENKKTKVILEDHVPEEMYITLKKYKEKYQDSFFCLSIMDNKIVNQEMEQFCLKNNINFKYKALKTKDNMLHGTGHLNEKGNEELGGSMYDFFQKFEGNKI